MLNGIKRIFSKESSSETSDDSEEYTSSEEESEDNPLTKAVSFIRDSFKKTPQPTSTPVAIPQSNEPNLLDKMIDGVRSISFSKTPEQETIHIDSAKFAQHLEMQVEKPQIWLGQSNAEKSYLIRTMDRLGLSKKTEQPVERKPQLVDDTPQRLPSGIYLEKPKMNPEPLFKGGLPEDFWTKIVHDPTICCKADYDRYMAEKSKRRAQRQQKRSAIRK